MIIPASVIVGFTGTQQGMTLYQKFQVEQLLVESYPVSHSAWFLHGDCTGADEEAHDIAKKIGYGICIFPPISNQKRAFCIGGIEFKAEEYLKRNLQIVKNCQFLIAAPKETREVLRSGTWSTIRYAKKLDKVVHIVYPFE